jgi:hypothetical protein
LGIDVNDLGTAHQPPCRVNDTRGKKRKEKRKGKIKKKGSKKKGGGVPSIKPHI